MERTLLNRDTLSGLLFVACGAFGLWLSRALPGGEAGVMGPGSLPHVLCWCMIGLGAIIAIKGAVVNGERLESWKIRPLVFVLASILAFYVLLPKVGLFLAALVTVVIGAGANAEYRLAEVLPLAVGLALVAVVALIYGLGLPIAAWPV